MGNFGTVFVDQSYWQVTLSLPLTLTLSRSPTSNPRSPSQTLRLTQVGLIPTLPWQSAIAASPASAHKGYLLGGLVWFTIPFALATSLGEAQASA